MNYLEMPIYKPYPLVYPSEGRCENIYFRKGDTKKSGVCVQGNARISTVLITTPPPSVLQLKFVRMSAFLHELCVFVYTHCLVAFENTEFL